MSRESDQLALQALARGKRNAAGWVRASCPFCPGRHGKQDRGQAFAIDPIRGVYTCWRCGVRGRVRNLDNAPPPEEIDEESQEEVTLPEEYRKIAGSKSVSIEAAREMLRRRRFHETLWEPLEVGVCMDGRYAERVVLPLRDLEGRLIGWWARTWTNRKPPHLLAPGMKRSGNFFNPKAICEKTDRPLIVTEGVLDAVPHWPDATAVLAKPTEDHIAVLRTSQRPVAVALDGDSWEESWVLSERLRFEGLRAGYIKLPPRKDPNDMSADWMYNRALECISAPYR